MRFQITFTQVREWETDSHEKNFERAKILTQPPYCAMVREVCLPANFNRLNSDSPFRERSKEERAVVVEISMEGLGAFIADYDLTATIVAQSLWDIAAEGCGDVLTHHIFIFDPASQAEGQNGF